MKPFFLIVTILSVLNQCLASDVVTCDDFRGKNFMQGMSCLFRCPRQVGNFSVTFSIATEKGRDPLEIESLRVESLEEFNHFDPLKKTYLIIHGFWSNGNVSWVKEMTEAILDTHDFNVIIIDWCDGCNTFNYVRAAQNTKHAADKIFKALFKMQAAVRRITKQPFVKENWNHLHIVGHSLGAHVAGVLGSLIKKNNTDYKVERITGLDPAGPCFDDQQSPANLRLDRGDADFVDVIHTQHSDSFTLGTKNTIGDVDFFVNGGAKQPVKPDNWIKNWATERIKSHSLAYQYFIESFENYRNRNCKFVGHPWDGTWEDAKGILEFVSHRDTCSYCTEMGYGTSKNTNNMRKFLVIAGTQSPHCDYKQSDYEKIGNALQKLKRSPVLRNLQYISPSEIAELFS